MLDIRVMALERYDAVIEFMHSMPGISLRDADSRQATPRYLERNPEMRFVAQVDGATCVCVMRGHDRRRGYLQHLLVLPRYWHQGIANGLVERGLARRSALSTKLPRQKWPARRGSACS